MSGKSLKRIELAAAASVALLGVFAGTGKALATPILSVDFDATADSQGDTTLTPQGFQSLTGSGTATTSASFTGNDSNSYTVAVNGQSGFLNRASANVTGPYANLYGNFVYINASNSPTIATITTAMHLSISSASIVPGTTYAVTVYSFDVGTFGTPDPASSTMTTTVSADASFTSTTQTGASGTVSWATPPSGGLNTAPTLGNQLEYATTIDVFSSTNTLNIQAIAQSNSTEQGLLRVNGIELSAVPEPASLSLLGLGALGLLARRRRTA